MLNRRLPIGLALAGLLLATATARAAALDPATLTGTWAGTWTNKTFGSTGVLGATVAVPDANTVTVLYTVSGSVFGCGTVVPTTLTLVKGTDFTDAGVNFTRQDAVFGAVALKSKKKGQKLVGGGKGTCNGAGPKSWRVTAKLVGTTLSGKMKIKVGGRTAQTSFTATKQ